MLWMIIALSAQAQMTTHSESLKKVQEKIVQAQENIKISEDRISQVNDKIGNLADNKKTLLKTREELMAKFQELKKQALETDRRLQMLNKQNGDEGKRLASEEKLLADYENEIAKLREHLGKRKTLIGEIKTESEKQSQGKQILADSMKETRSLHEKVISDLNQNKIDELSWMKKRAESERTLKRWENEKLRHKTVEQKLIEITTPKTELTPKIKPQ